jgi:hypothetical protein
LFWKLESVPKKIARKRVLKVKIVIWFIGITSFKNGAMPSLGIIITVAFVVAV